MIFTPMKSQRPSAADDTISTNELRYQISRVLHALRAGRSLTVTYLDRPLARIVPVNAAAAPQANAPIFRLHELAEPIGPLTNAEVDRAIYGK